MGFMIVGIYTITLLLFFIGIGVPIGLTFILSGFIGSLFILPLSSSFSLLSDVAYFSIASPSWVSLPLFILMGAFAARGGFAQRAYRGFYTLFSGVPGSLGVATSFGCAAFGAISGSSLATAAIFGKLALPEMRKFNYDKGFATATVACSGTFASMIPPSMDFIVYGIFTNTSIGRLFFGGIIPGLITSCVYSLSIIYRAKYNKKLAPHPENQPLFSTREKIIEFSKGWTIALVALMVLGGIYSGIFTPTEAAAAGSIIVLVISVLGKNIRKMVQVKDALRESADITAMIFLINIGALYYSRVLSITRLPSELTTFLINLDVSPFFILLAVMVIFFILGMIMVPFGIFALVLPIALPVLTRFGYDPVWFGVITIKLMEIAAVTPPVGLNIYTIKGVVEKDISLIDIFSGIWPFVLCDFIVLVFLILFPQLVLWLPNLFFH